MNLIFCAVVMVLVLVGAYLIPNILIIRGDAQLMDALYEQEVRLSNIVAKLRGRKQYVRARRLEARSKRLMGTDQFDELCASVQCRLLARGHERLAAALEKAYGSRANIRV